MLPDPVLIVANPRSGGATAWRLHALASYALSEQRAPLVLHPAHMPWMIRDNGELRPPASLASASVLRLVARHGGGRLWVLLDDGDDLEPSWARGILRAWRRDAGRMPSRMRRGTWDEWSLALVNVPHETTEARRQV